MCETLDLPRSPAERQETEKLKTTNYFDTFIRVAEDCPATSGMVPPLFVDNPMVAAVQHEMIAGCPYTNPFKVSFQPLSNLAVDTWGCLEF
jgi:hypothetical protein